MKQKLEVLGLALTVLGSLVVAAAFVYNHFFISPIMSYNDATGEFSVQTDFRGISMRVYPQMVIRLANTVILLIHLDGYLEQETIQFEDKKAVIVRDHQEYCDLLQYHIYQAVLETLSEKLCGEEEVENKIIQEVTEQLKIDVSFIGGVQYQAPWGNRIEKYCIIECNGLLVDCVFNSKKVEQRLYEYELILSDDLESISTSIEIQGIVSTVVEGINSLYGNSV